MNPLNSSVRDAPDRIKSGASVRRSARVMNEAPYRPAASGVRGGVRSRQTRLKPARLAWQVQRRFAPGGCWLTVGRYASAGQAIFKRQELCLLYPGADFRVERAGQTEE